MVVNKWTEKIEELEKENKGYETAYTRAVLKNEESKKYDKWYANCALGKNWFCLRDTMWMTGLNWS